MSCVILCLEIRFASLRFVWWHMNFHWLFNAKAILEEEQQWYYSTHISTFMGYLKPKPFLVEEQQWYYSTHISTFMGYLMPNPFLVEEQQWYYLTHSWRDKTIIPSARRCPWCSRYRRRKWTRRHEFKSWTRLIAFHIALIPLGKVWIQNILPPAMGKIVGQTRFFSLG